MSGSLQALPSARERRQRKPLLDDSSEYGGPVEGIGRICPEKKILPLTDSPAQATGKSLIDVNSINMDWMSFQRSQDLRSGRCLTMSHLYGMCDIVLVMR